MKRQANIPVKLRENVSLPNLPLVEICGDRRILIENHRGMCGYSREKICVKVQYGLLEIQGEGMEIACIQKHRLLITGRLDAVLFFRGN